MCVCIFLMFPSKWGRHAKLCVMKEIPDFTLDPTDRGAWWAVIHEVAKSRTLVSNLCVCVCDVLQLWMRAWEAEEAFGNC